MRVCQTCGSIGYSEALVVCSKCQTISEHTYCLDKLEETDNGQIRWTCEFCEPRVIQLSDSTNDVSDTETIESFKELQDDAEKPHCSSRSVEAQTVRDSGTGPSTNESSFNQDLDKNHNLHSPREYSEATRIEASNSAFPETSSILEDDFYSTVEPLPNPIWMGDFQLYGEYNYTVHGMVAHIANVASKEVSEVASSLPMLLCVDMVPKISIWPIKFKEMEPTADNIAVYFFPEDYRAERVYDCLVEDIIEHKFAMISKFNNVELLIFSSCELPLDNWRFQRKYYLWGLFRKKKTLPQNQSDGCPSRLYGRNIDHTWPSDLSDETGTNR